MTDTTAKIRGKGLDATGITEEIASDLFNRVGTHLMAIVDLQVVDRHGPDVKGKRGVELIIDGIEPATDDTLAEHLRELTRTVYLNRQHHGAQLSIDDALDDEPTVEGVIAAGTSQRPHPFLPVDAADDNGICDVCGLLESAPRHSTQEQLPDGEEHDEDLKDSDPEDSEADPATDDAEDPWEYEQPEPATTGVGSPFDIPDPAA